MSEIQEVELLRGRPRKYKKRKRKKLNWKLVIYIIFALMIVFLVVWAITSTSLLDSLKKLFIIG
ncbi:hypothetical protein [Paenibacillus faecalis]|uniref:hypothetical protein n=1 Tax=Paenibacillus faecalis TaxID=2079532 RepID=UPI000D0FFB34|nr:hypothetical protein [Paenibacillus faecalis]